MIHLTRILFNALLTATLTSGCLLQAAANNQFDCSKLTEDTNTTWLDNKATVFYLNITRVGSVVFGIDPKDKQLGHIRRMWTEKEFRRQGIGSYMIKRTVERLQQDGCTKVQLTAYPLDVDSDNFALFFNERTKLITFYKKHGFEIVDEVNAVMQKLLPKED